MENSIDMMRESMIAKIKTMMKAGASESEIVAKLESDGYDVIFDVYYEIERMLDDE